jgi:hypothetical protein
MDQAIKHWLGLWDYLDGNFWGFHGWACVHLSPDEVAVIVALANQDNHES